MRNKLIAVLIVVGLSLPALGASAMMGKGKGMMDGKGHGGPGKAMMMREGMGGGFMKMVAMLDLNAEQKKAVEAIHFAHRKEMIRKEADIEVAEIDLREIMGKEPVNVEEAERQIRDIAVMHADLDVMHLKAKEAMKAKLTPEQLEKMKKYMAAAMEEKMEDMGGMGMGTRMDRDDSNMDCKKKKCAMMGDDDDGEKASDAAAHDGKVEGKKMEHAHHH